jgi:hypothetical protein
VPEARAADGKLKSKAARAIGPLRIDIGLS